MSVSTASTPALSCEPPPGLGGASVYASSMKSIPPMASSQAFAISSALSLEYLLTSVLRSCSQTLSDGNMPIALNTSPSFRARVVFPVPGLPVSRMCTGVSSAEATPAAMLMRSNCILAASSRTCCFMLSIPTKASSSVRSSSKVFSLSSPAMSAFFIMVSCTAACARSVCCMIKMRCACCFFALSSTLRTSRAFPNFALRIRYIFLK